MLTSLGMVTCCVCWPEGGINWDAGGGSVELGADGGMYIGGTADTHTHTRTRTHTKGVRQETLREDKPCPTELEVGGGRPEGG